MAKKNRMGAGLDMLFADNSQPEVSAAPEQQESGKDNVTMVKITLLEPNKDQPRGIFDNDKLMELADSIRENGVIQPILARPLENGGYQIVAGERRWRASRLAGLTEVPVYIKKLDDKQTMQVALIENIQRADLSPIEEAKAYKNLMDTYKMTQEQVARAVGKSRSAVANSLRILDLSESVRDMVDRGEISFGHAKVLSGWDHATQREMAELIVEKNLSVRELEDEIKNMELREKREDAEIKKSIRKNSVKKDRPFLYEFIMAVRVMSEFEVNAKEQRDGGVKVELKIPKEADAEMVLSKLANFLTGDMESYKDYASIDEDEVD